MKIEEDTIIFKTEGYFFDKERDGRKPNTIRIITSEEAWQLQVKEPKRIRIIEPARGEFFERDITDISCVGHSCGKPQFVFSWRCDSSTKKECEIMDTKLVAEKFDLINEVDTEEYADQYK